MLDGFVGGRPCPTFGQVFDGAGHGTVKHLNECWTDGVCFAGRPCPTFVEVFDGAGHGAIGNLNECWTGGVYLLAGRVQYSFKFSMAPGTVPSET